MEEEMKYPVTAARLKEAMEMNGIIAQDLADKTGIHKSSISQYINGSHTPSIKSAAKMAAVLNVGAAWLKGYDVPMAPPAAKGQTSYADIIAKLKDLDQPQLEALRLAVEEERLARYRDEIERLKQQISEGQPK